MAFDETFKSVRVYLRDRMTSPLFGAFFISCVVYNYRAFWVLFSSGPINEKFEHIDKLYPADWTWSRFWEWDNWYNHIHLIGVPLIYACIFLVAYPVLSRPFFWWWRWQQKKLKEMLQRIDKEIPTSPAELEKIIKSYESKLDDLSGFISKRENEIDRLRKAIKEEENKNAEMKSQIDSLKALNISNEDIRKSMEIRTQEQNIQNAILNNTLRLYYKPDDERAYKDMTFLREGRILQGRNKNEYSWAIKNGKLEFYNSEGVLFSRFDYTPEKRFFISTDDGNVNPATHGQRMAILSESDF